MYGQSSIAQRWGGSRSRQGRQTSARTQVSLPSPRDALRALGSRAQTGIVIRRVRTYSVCRRRPGLPRADGQPSLTVFPFTTGRACGPRAARFQNASPGLPACSPSGQSAGLPATLRSKLYLQTEWREGVSVSPPRDTIVAVYPRRRREGRSGRASPVRALLSRSVDGTSGEKQLGEDGRTGRVVFTWK